MSLKNHGVSCHVWEGYEIEGRQPAFSEQRQAMFLAYSWHMGLNVHTQSVYRWDIARFSVGPRGSRTVAGYWPNWLVIPRGSRHVAQAFAWLDYLSGVGVRAWFHHFPDLPTNLKVPRDILPMALVDGKGKAFAQDIMNFFRDQLDIATSDELSNTSCTMSRRRRVRMSAPRRHEARAGLLFVLPWLLSLLLFTTYPVLTVFYLSCTDYNIVQPPRRVGLQNYRTMFTANPAFWTSVGNSAYYALLSVPLGLAGALGLPRCSGTISRTCCTTQASPASASWGIACSTPAP